MLNEWTRIPSPFESEQDRRTLAAILTAAGLEVRIVRARTGNPEKGPFKRFVEYRQQK